jgi:hypothetical protein
VNCDVEESHLVRRYSPVSVSTRRPGTDRK